MKIISSIKVERTWAKTVQISILKTMEIKQRLIQVAFIQGKRLNLGKKLTSSVAF